MYIRAIMSSGPIETNSRSDIGLSSDMGVVPGLWTGYVRHGSA